MERTEIDTAVAEWLRLDRDPETRAEIQTLVDAGDDAELTKRFSKRIAFGTAGLRARMQAGLSSMNALIILQATQGLVRYAAANVEAAKERGVVIGHDHRYRSKRFAELAANVCRREGFKVLLLEGLVHTPMVPFTASRVNAALGIMITASHNPAPDNGYKVYFANHVQIIPPHDAGIADQIMESLEVAPEAWDVIPAEIYSWKGTDEMKAAYFEMVQSLSLHKEQNIASSLVFSYTAMHGVGLEPARKAFATFGFPSDNFSIVQEQAQPDPSFPTVKFPNPEEKGALDLAIAHADRIGSSIVLANDPDADRFCAAEKSSGSWRVFTGDQLGTLLGDWALKRYQQSGAPIGKLAMCASTVSSKMLRAMAKKEGFVFRETLTGFKFLGNEALKLQEAGYSCTMAYEEAIGYAVSEAIRDKDGVTALAAFCEMAEQLRLQGLTVGAHLDALYDRYGYFKTSNSYFICADPAKTDRIFSILRYGSLQPDQPYTPPKTLGGYSITYLRDLTVGYDTSNPPSFVPDLPVDPSAHMISFALGSTEEGDGVEVTGTVRTSGTEPKIKFYLEGSGKNRSAVEAKLEQVRTALGVEWLRKDENELQSA